MNEEYEAHIKRLDEFLRSVEALKELEPNRRWRRGGDARSNVGRRDYDALPVSEVDVGYGADRHNHPLTRRKEDRRKVGNEEKD